MASTRSRPRGREHARPSSGGVAAEHATKIYTVAIVGIVVIIAFLALTSIGHVIDAATQHFMLFYAGVFALIGLCASVGLGLVATDRMFLHPGHRVFIQSAHRAASFGAVAFLIIHIITEILAQRVHVLDAVIPFLSPFRTFYIGLGTIASDLIILLVITGIMRGRFNASGKAWRWRAIHYTSYLSFVFGVWHGLLAGRPGKPYVDWSYGFVVAFVLLGLAVRVLSNSLRPKENLSAPPVDRVGKLGVRPAAGRGHARPVRWRARRHGRPILGAGTGSQPVLSAPVSAPVLTALPAGAAVPTRASRTTSLARRAAAVPGRATGHGIPVPCRGRPPGRCHALHRARCRDASGPCPACRTGPMPPGPAYRADAAGHRADAAGNTGPLPPRAPARCPAADRPHAAPVSGPMPPRQRPDAAGRTRPCPRATPALSGHGPLPPYPRQRAHAGAAGERPDAAYPGRPAADGGPHAAAAAGRMPGAHRPRDRPEAACPTGPHADGGPGRCRDWATGPAVLGRGARPGPARPRARAARTGPLRRPRPPATGPMAPQGPALARGRPTGPLPQAGGRAVPPTRAPSAADGDGRQPVAAADGRAPGWQAVGYDGSWYPEEPPWDDGFPETDPNLRYREPGPGMPGYRGSREHRYGGDRY